MSEWTKFIELQAFENLSPSLPPHERVLPLYASVKVCVYLLSSTGKVEVRTDVPAVASLQMSARVMGGLDLLKKLELYVGLSTTQAIAWSLSGYISRKVHREKSSWDSNQCSAMGCRHSKWWLNLPLLHCVFCKSSSRFCLQAVKEVNSSHFIYGHLLPFWRLIYLFES